MSDWRIWAVLGILACLITLAARDDRSFAQLQCEKMGGIHARIQSGNLCLDRSAVKWKETE